MIAQFLFNGLASGCQIALFALAFWLLYSVARFVDVNLAGLFVITGFAFIGLTKTVGIIGAVFTTVVLGAALGIASEKMVYGPLIRRSATTAVLLASSLGLYQLVVNVAALVWGDGTRLLPSEASMAMEVGPVLITRSQAAQLAAAALLCGAWLWLLLVTRLGLTFRAAAQDETLYSSYGMRASAIQTGAFTAAGALVALAACIAASDAGVNPGRGMPALLDALTAVLLGGSVTVVGPVIGALALGLVKGLVSWQFSERWEPAVTLVVLLIVLTFRPAGIRALVARTA